MSTAFGKRLRRFALGARTLAGLDGGGWFIPGRHARPGARPPYPAIEPLFAAAEPVMREVLDDIADLRPALEAIPAAGKGLRWSQSWFPRLDAAAAYALVRTLRPRLIVEVGSGHSTRFMAKALADAGEDGALVAIDPGPRAPLAAIGYPHLRHVACLMEEADPQIFAGLGPGDILFIDSSHVAMPGTDVDRLFLDVLPRLPAGVFVHIHDIFLPDPYPAGWTWRGYNEQLLVAALLQGRGMEIVFASHYALTRLTSRAERALGTLPLAPGAIETSLWLRKV